MFHFYLDYIYNVLFLFSDRTGDKNTKENHYYVSLTFDF